MDATKSQVFNGIIEYKYMNYTSLDIDGRKEVDNFTAKMRESYESGKDIEFFQYIDDYYTNYTYYKKISCTN